MKEWMNETYHKDSVVAVINDDDDYDDTILRN